MGLYGSEAEVGLDYMAVEVSYGSRWIDINDGYNFKISGEATRDNSQKTWRKTIAESPVLGGNYLVHAVPEMVNEQVNVWVYGADQTQLSENVDLITQLFEQYSFTIRWTFDDFREYWNCQLATSVHSRGQVLTHNAMAGVAFTVPRYPNVTKERV